MSDLTLVIDASSYCTQVVILGPDSILSEYKSTDPVLKSFFEILAAIQKKWPLNQFTHIIFCSGPGSLLGISIVTMYLRTLLKLYPHLEKSTYSYNALELAHFIIKKQYTDFKDFHIIKRSRLDYYYLFKDNKISEIHENELEKMETLFLILDKQNMRNNLKKVKLIEYNIIPYIDQFRKNENICMNENIEPLMLNKFEFKKWEK